MLKNSRSIPVPQLLMQFSNSCDQMLSSWSASSEYKWFLSNIQTILSSQTSIDENWLLASQQCFMLKLGKYNHRQEKTSCRPTTCYGLNYLYFKLQFSGNFLSIVEIIKPNFDIMKICGFKDSFLCSSYIKKCRKGWRSIELLLLLPDVGEA